MTATSRALLLCLATLRPAAGHTQIFAPARPHTRNSIPLKRLTISAKALQANWLLATPPGLETWAGINAWQRFVIVDALTQYTEVSGDHTYLPLIEAAVINHSGLDGNDDDLWAVISSLHVYRLHPSPMLLQFASAKFAELADGYWDETCGGGMWWDHDRTYKNAITNELFLYAATELFRLTDEPVYSTWAQKEWIWFNHSGMINPDHLVNDGLTAACKNNGSPTYTYNQGVLLGGLVNLYQMDKDDTHLQLAAQIAHAAILHLTKDGILSEPTPTLNQDGQTFKGVFVSHLGDLVPVVRDAQLKVEFSSFLTRNATAVWTRRDRRNNKLNSYWGGTSISFGAAAQAAALQLFLAAYRASDSSAQPAN